MSRVLLHKYFLVFCILYLLIVFPCGWSFICLALLQFLLAKVEAFFCYHFFLSLLVCWNQIHFAQYFFNSLISSVFISFSVVAFKPKIMFFFLLILFICSFTSLYTIFTTFSSTHLLYFLFSSPNLYFYQSAYLYIFNSISFLRAIFFF